MVASSSSSEKNKVKKSQQHYSSYWYYERMFGCTYEGLGLYRLFLGILLTFELILRYRFLHAFYSEDGTLPVRLLLPKIDDIYKVLCVHCYNDTLLYQQILLTIQVISAIMFTLGIGPIRLTSIISWVLYLSLTLRNTWQSFILDRYFHYLLFYSIVLSPYMKKYSLWWNSNNSSTNSRIRLMVTNLATIAIKLQILWIYLDAGYGKYTDPLKGWTYNAQPLPALDTYTRHTIGAQYVYAILQPQGLRILTPIVVYIELLASPIALLGSFFNINAITYTAIFLIVGLHLGISFTLRNTVLLSLVASCAWCTYLPLSTTTTRKQQQQQQQGQETGVSRTPTPGKPTTMNNIGMMNILSNLCIISLICGSVWFEVYLDKACDDSSTNKHIWSTLLHNRWNVFVGAEEYVTWEIAPGLLQDGSVVDVWGRTDEVNWNMPNAGAPCTSTSRPGRWRSFPYLANITDGEDGDALWGYLCKQWNKENFFTIQDNPGRRLIKYNFFMLQADVLPNMGFSPTRKRLIHTYECKYNNNNDDDDDDISIKQVNNNNNNNNNNVEDEAVIAKQQDDNNKEEL